MNKKQKEELLALLVLWFKETDLNQRNLFNQNVIAKLIKTKIKESGRWSEKIRGKRNVENLKKKPKEIKAQLYECGAVMKVNNNGVYYCDECIF